MPRCTTKDGVELHYKQWGATGRPVVLIHGWPLSSDSWDPIALALAEAGHKVVAYDRRGFGRSDQPWEGYDYDTMADDLRDVMQAAGIQAHAAIVGFSMGGGEVARYMSRHRGRGVEKAVLISSVVPYMLKTDDNPDGVSEDQLAEIAGNLRKDRPAFFKTFFKDFFGVGMVQSPVSDATLDWAWRLAMQAGLRATLECAKAFGFTDFRPDLAAFDVPTLVIHGTGDKTVPIDTAGRAAAKGIRDAKLIEYDGAPHGLFKSHQDRLIEDLKAFIG
ncbi:alpha/beta fold hydrolase [Stakelama saccharophila]|uniref:Alpha/beta hydrolase n=1 Tax=Stakelama saccharophila TaxID=3075605 RepID=A0ABZ0B735_9SPHN|nr:alpha/beta hydrolase [Stakelama sp. W311]WNO52810.1 alpha/beta hydrolase [Stakelama sp. W311]